MFGKQWTNTEDDFMRKHYPSESNPAICENWEEASGAYIPAQKSWD